LLFINYNQSSAEANLRLPINRIFNDIGKMEQNIRFDLVTKYVT